MTETILIIDGQGGKMGRQLVEAARSRFPTANILAVGTNSNATAAMLKGGAHNAATGENSVIVAARRASVILCPLGLVIADSLLGEVTDKMALAIAKSSAKKILIPLNRCDSLVAGIRDSSITELLEDAMDKCAEALSS